MTQALPDIWLTANEIAQEALPSLPTTKRGVHDLAAREGWQRRRGARRRKGAGGGWEYHVSVLPPEAQRALVAKRSAPVVSDGGARKLAIIEDVEALWLGSGFGKDAAVREIARKHAVGAATVWGWLSAVSTVPRGERLAVLSQMDAAPSTAVGAEIDARLDALPTTVSQLQSYQRETMEARLALLGALETDLALGGTIADFAERSASDPTLSALAMKTETRGGVVSARTLKRWRSLRRDGGDIALAPVPRRKARRSKPDWANVFLEFYARPSKPSVSWSYEEMLRVAPEGMAIPSLRTVTRWVRSLGEIEKARGRVGPRELKSIRAYVVRDTAGLLPTDVYTADGHTLDMEVLHPANGRPFRPEITSVLDVATRRCVGWSVGLAESAHGVADAHRMAFRHGVSAIVYVDNGSGFKNNYLDDAVNGVLARAGSAKKHSLPYGSQARGIIERFNGTCWVRATKAMPGYVGADMDPEARQLVFRKSRGGEGQSPLFDWATFMEWAEATIGRYNDRPHTGLPKIADPESGKKRHQSPNEAWEGHVANEFEPILLDEETALDLWRPYESRQVRRGTVQINGNSYFSKALEYGDFHGEMVRVGYDIHDPAHVWVRDYDNRLICVAELDGNKTPYFPQSVVEKAREQRAVAQIKRLDLKKQVKLAQTRGGLEYVPAETFDVPLSVESRASVARLSGEVEGDQPFALPDDPAKKYRLWQQLDRRFRDGETLGEREAKFHRSFEKTPDFRVAQKLEKKAADAAKKEGTA